jgi:hypothetical protein
MLSGRNYGVQLTLQVVMIWNARESIPGLIPWKSVQTD